MKVFVEVEFSAEGIKSYDTTFCGIPDVKDIFELDGDICFIRKSGFTRTIFKDDIKQITIPPNQFKGVKL